MDDQREPIHPVHVTLLGDSILDNAAYTDGEPSVVDHLQMLLRPTGSATLRAVDGAVTRQVSQQLAHLPAQTTHLVVSTGGNDALQQIDLLLESVATVSDALEQFCEPLALFERDYRALLEQVLHYGIPTWCCTIYNGMLEPPLDTVAPVAASLFNDVIYRTAGRTGFPVIELRHVCTAAGDYANQIEPSGVGGAKIARAILKACCGELLR